MIIDDSTVAELHNGTGNDCLSCEHSTDIRECKAFDFIPSEIWLGKFKHNKPYPNDNGIQFEAIKHH